MVDLSLPALLAGYVVATLVPAITIYVVLANLVEARLEEAEERLTDRISEPRGIDGERAGSAPETVHPTREPPSEVPPAPQLSGEEVAEPPLERWSDQG